MLSKVKKPVYEMNEAGLIVMSKKNLKIICNENQQYNTAYLNDDLYLHMRGFHKIENLEDFTDLKTLYLQNNKISVIENLGHLQSLLFLYLQNNSIYKIQNLPLTNLKVLNLANNQISVIQNLSELISLESLNVSQNELMTAESIQGLVECPSLKEVDLSKNKIPSSDALYPIFVNMPNLSCLIMKGNPLIDDMPNYRKKMICLISSLTFLDNSTITPNERRLAKAWLVGGSDAIFQERVKMFAERMAKGNYVEIALQEDEEDIYNERSEQTEEQKIENIGKQVRKQVEKEFADRLEGPLKKKEELLKFMPVGYQVILNRLEAEIKDIEKEAQRKEEIIKQRLDIKLAEITKVSRGNAEKLVGSESERLFEKKKEFEEYIERKNLIWLINEPQKGLSKVKKVEAPADPEIENTSNVVQTQNGKEDKGATEKPEDFIKNQYMEFHKVVDMMDRYIANISKENWTLGDLMGDAEFRELYSKINEIANYFNTQAQDLLRSGK